MNLIDKEFYNTRVPLIFITNNYQVQDKSSVVHIFIAGVGGMSPLLERKTFVSKSNLKVILIGDSNVGKTSIIQ